MDKTAWIVCNAFLAKAGASKKNALVSYLPSRSQELLKALGSPEKDPMQVIFKPAEVLKLIHYSWFTPFLRSLGEAEISLFLGIFPETEYKKLKKALLFSKPIQPISSFAKKYLESVLIDHLMEGTTDILPLELLPHSPLNTLVDISHESLQSLIEYFGLHDLAVEIKQIIDTMKLKKIHSVLSPEKEAYLKILSQKKEAVLFKRMELSKWDGKAETLEKVLYHRGLNRLAKALYPENPSLLWYVSHKLPWEQASSLQSLVKPLEHPKAASMLSHQLLEVIPLVHKKSAKEPS